MLYTGSNPLSTLTINSYGDTLFYNISIKYWRCARPLGGLREIRSSGLEEGKSAAEPMS